ncbi:hypothetical protein V8C86DRAFT_2589602 [Haematococcus lacustris]
MPPGKNRTPLLSAKTLDLAAEAADMEAKLIELRKAMEREREKRERSTPDTGPHWSNGATGLLRGQFRAGAKAGPGITTAAGAATGVATNTATSTSAASSRASSAAPTARKPTQIPPLQQQSKKPSTQTPLFMPSRPAACSPVTQPGETLAVNPVKAPAAQRPPIASLTRKPQVMAIHEASDEPGTGCGTEAGAETGPGPHAAAFNEADSHRSFLEALNEWRSGLKAAQPSPAAPAADAQPLGTSNTTSRPGSSSQGSAIEVQTDVARPRPLAMRPSSPWMSQPLPGQASGLPQPSQPQTYFDRFALNVASRTAGQAASGQAGAASSPRAATSVPPVAAAAHDMLGLVVNRSSSGANTGLWGGRSPSGSSPSGGPHGLLSHGPGPGQPARLPSLMLSPSSRPGPDSCAAAANSVVYSLDVVLPPAVESSLGSGGGQQGTGQQHSNQDGSGLTAQHHSLPGQAESNNGIGAGCSAAGPRTGARHHKGLDILEELERLELQRHRAAVSCDSDDEFFELTGSRRGSMGTVAGGHPHRGVGGGNSSRESSQAQAGVVVTTQTGHLGLTKGARLPDAILLPDEDTGV